MLGQRTKYSVLSTKYSLLSALAAFAISSLLQAAPPKLNYFFPAGGQRSQTVTITASGDFSNWPVQVWADRPGVVGTADKDKGKLNLAIAADAVPGIYWLRLTNAEGASQPRAFIVGTLPEVAEAETNDLPAKPQIVESRVVVNGKLAKTNDVDGFRVNLQQGQTLVAALQANTILGSPMDAVLQICDLVERPPVAGQAPQLEAYVVAQNHDGLGLDPQLAFTAPKSGPYLVRLFAFPATPDSSIRFAGGDDYLYRLTLTTGPYIDHALPLAAPREESEVRLGGWNLTGVTTAIVPSLANDSDSLTPPDSPLTWVWNPNAAGALAISRADYAALSEDQATLVALARSASEDPAEHDAVQDLPIPVAISGRLELSGEADIFTFQASKDQKLRLRATAKALGYPIDPVLLVQDETGKVLAEADDTGRDDRDPQLDFTAPAAGRYRAVVRDLHGRGGLRMVYRLSIEPVLPDFTLTLAADSFVFDKDKPLEIPVSVTVRDGLRDPIILHAIGLPPGVTAEPATFTPTEDAPQPMSGSGRRGRRSSGQSSAGPSVKLILKADPNAVQPGGFAVRIEGRTAASSPLIRSARFPLNLPLAGSHHAAWLTIRK
jgi:hypothetical protein